MEVIFFNWFDIGISFNDFNVSLLEIIWDESTTNLQGVKFLCWMDERNVRIQGFALFPLLDPPPPELLQ